jgi:uncharacterized protein
VTPTATPEQGGAAVARAWREEACTFTSAGGALLIGVLSTPATPTGGDLGVLIIVGGPQTRVGSHRQFVQVARRSAAAGFAVLRFDVRGKGDSDGVALGFENPHDDVAAAIDVLCARTGVRRVVLWGLCDGASAALLYQQRAADPRVAGLCLLNPWVRTAGVHATVQVKHYYGEKLRDPAFWWRALRGGVPIRSVTEYAARLLAMLKGRVRRPAAAAEPGYVERMAMGWMAFGRPILLALSGRDHTAREFEDVLANNPAWHGALAVPGLERHSAPQADHTFSRVAHADALDEHWLAWLQTLR